MESNVSGNTPWALESTSQTILQKIENIITTLAGVKTNTDKIQDIKTQTDKIPSIQSQTNNISAIKTQTDKIGSIQTTLNTVKSSTDNISAIKTQTDKIGSMQTTLNTVKSSTDNISAIKSKVDSISTGFNGLNNGDAISVMDHLIQYGYREIANEPSADYQGSFTSSFLHSVAYVGNGNGFYIKYKNKYGNQVKLNGPSTTYNKQCLIHYLPGNAVYIYDFFGNLYSSSSDIDNGTPAYDRYEIIYYGNEKPSVYYLH